MSWNDGLALWCGVFAVVALVGYGRSLAGVTRAQRTVRATGRIEKVREPRHGSSHRDGISVVVSFQDPSTGQEFTVTNDGEHGERITTAWPGREIGVHYPPGRPHAFRFVIDLEPSRHGRGWPNFAVFLIYAGLVAVAAINWGWPWALLGFGVPWTVSGAFYLPQNARHTSRHIERLAATAPVRARVIAVLKDVSTDEDGHTSTTLTPVIAFTTHEGTDVTAYYTSGPPIPAEANGRQIMVHYAPDDPAVFTLDLAAEHRTRRVDFAFSVLALAVGVGAVAAGAVLL
jgi:hypothetical protein